MNIGIFKTKWRTFVGWFLIIWSSVELFLIVNIILTPVPDQSAPDHIQEAYLESVRTLNAYSVLYFVLIIMLGRWLIRKDKQKVEPAG